MLHLTLLIWVAGCCAAAYWQVTRAADGNALSYLYAVEWPVFAVAGVVGWYALINIEKPTEAEEQERRDFETQRRAEIHAAREAEVESPELAAYNDHLEQLAKSPKRKIFGH